MWVSLYGQTKIGSYTFTLLVKQYQENRHVPSQPMAGCRCALGLIQTGWIFNTLIIRKS